MKALVVLLLLLVGCSSAPTRADSTDPTPARDDTTVEDETTFEETDAIQPVEEAEVEFASENATLRGTVLYPAGPVQARQGVVIAHDYGPMGRDGVVAETFAVALPVEVPVYRSIAEHLASRGFVVLIYDKRTCVTGSAPGCTYPRSYIDDTPALGDALVTDALAAASFLERRDDVDDAAVSFVGHGQGAEVAMLAASRRDDAKVVMLAPSAHALDEIVQWQTKHSAQLLERRIEAVGDTPEADLLAKQLAGLRAQIEEQKAMFEKLRGDTRATDEVLGLSPETWRSYFKLHASYLAVLRSGEVPALAVLADADRNYPPESAERMESVMRAQEDESFVLVTEVTHPMVGIGGQDDPTVVSPIVLNVVTDFLAR